MRTLSDGRPESDIHGLSDMFVFSYAARIWDLTTGQCLVVVDANCYDLAPLAGGRFVSTSGQEHTLEVFDGTGQCVASFQAPFTGPDRLDATHRVAARLAIFGGDKLAACTWAGEVVALTWC